jgi:hypothetical protein
MHGKYTVNKLAEAVLASLKARVREVKHGNGSTKTSRHELCSLCAQY